MKGLTVGHLPPAQATYPLSAPGLVPSDLAGSFPPSPPSEGVIRSVWMRVGWWGSGGWTRLDLVGLAWTGVVEGWSNGLVD